MTQARKRTASSVRRASLTSTSSSGCAQPARSPIVRERKPSVTYRTVPPPRERPRSTCRKKCSRSSRSPMRYSAYAFCRRSATCCSQRSSVRPARQMTMPRVNASHGLSVPLRSPSQVALVASTFGPGPLRSAISAWSSPAPALNSIARPMSVKRSSARPAFTSFSDSRTLSVPLAAVRIRRTSSGTSFPEPSVFARVCASASAAESSALVMSRELEIAAGRDRYLRAAMAQDVERGRADHRAVVRAKGRPRDAERVPDAPRDRFAERKVRGDAATEEDRLDRVLGGRAGGLLGEHLGDRFLEGSGDVGDRHIAFLLQLAHEPQHGGLEAAEREVEPIRRQRSRQRERVGVALLRDPLDDGTPRESEVEKPRDLVERLARGVVDGPAERSKAAVRLHEHEIAVRAAHHEHDRGELGLRRNILGLVQPVRVHVPLEMIDPDERKTGREREATRVIRADEKATDEPGADGRGDGVDLRQLPPRVAQRLLGEHIERTEMLARRDLGDDATGVLMAQLRRDDVRTDPPPILDDRDAGLIARRLDREDPQPDSCSSALSFARRSRTGRSRSRSVHMMSASSLLSE